MIGVLGAIPSLAWVAVGSGFLIDDWAHAAQSHSSGFFGPLGAVTNRTGGRPGAIVFYAVTYAILGLHPVWRGLVLALLNGVSAGLVFVVADRLVGRGRAWWIALAWVALPNRSSTRLWFSTGPEVVAFCLLPVAVWLLTSDRPFAGGLALAVGILFYEGIAATGIVAIGIWWVRRSRHLGPGVQTLAPAVLATAWIWSHSPKVARGLHPFTHLSTLVAAQAGTGLFGPPWATRMAWGLADELGWAKTHDAEYVALARLLGCRLVTLDGRLRRGADRLGIVITPGER